MNAQSLIRSWLDGRAAVAADGSVRLRERPTAGVADKVRRAYDWIANRALLSPYHDLTFDIPKVLDSPAGPVELPRGEAYSSFVLLPLLNLLAGRRLVFVGGPGRGKTTMAVLMGVLAGDPLADVRRRVQHGHPQLTLADLLGGPLPADLVSAATADAIRVRWRAWVTARVKIIDEYNRIPTKTQSALLSLMAEGYAEMYEQTVYCGRSAWYLTANDDQGGGTFPVIEALKDRIDVVVRCVPFHPRFLDTLAGRVAGAAEPESFIPADLVCSPADLDEADRAVRAVPVPPAVLELLGALLGQLDFCRRASDRPEFQNKDTLHLAGRRVGHVCNEDCPLDKSANLCTQTETGVSPRAVQSLLHFAQALAYFRGRPAVGAEDVRAVLPWVLHDKLPANPLSGFFQKPEHHVDLTDRVAWLHQLFDRAASQLAAYGPARKGTVELQQVCAGGFGGTPTPELRQRLGQIEARLAVVLREGERNALVAADVVLLKDLYVRAAAELRGREGGPAR